MMLVLDTLIILSVVAVALFLMIYYYYQPSSKHCTNSSPVPNGSYYSFRIRFLFVNFLVLTSEWLQGPYIYQLYQSYGYDTGTMAKLFITSYVAGATVGTWLGSLADRWGRRRLCLLFCFLFALHCILLSFQAFYILFVGRILAGTSKVLLFTVFEAWMVHEHYVLGYTDQQLKETFSWATFINGGAAIFSGIIGNLMVPYWGIKSPCLLAIVILILSSALIFFTWSENYGSYEICPQFFFDTKALSQGLKIILKDPKISCVGLMQSLFEAAMFTFIFVWPPALERTLVVEIPYGLVFSCLVLSMMVGSLLARLLDISLHPRTEVVALMTLSVGATSLGLSAFTESFDFKLICFNVFELIIGMYLPILASLRHHYIPASTRSTILSLFRIPLSLLVILSLLYVDILPLETILLICAVFLLLGIPCLIFLFVYQPKFNPPLESSPLLP